MDERDGFYFHRSFWESIELMNAKDQLALFKAITVFALNGTEPEKLTSNQKASWVLIRPVLTKGRNKAANGKKGGSKKEANRKQNESKQKSVSDLPLSDNNSDSESDKGVILTNYDKGVILTNYDKGVILTNYDKGVNEPAETAPPNDGSLFTVFWNAYPETARRKREDAWKAWKALNPAPEEAARIMTCLDAWKKSKRWTDDNGEFIPNAENFLNPQKGYLYMTPPPAKQPVPKGASGQLGAAELEAIQKVLREEWVPSLFQMEGT